MFWKIVLIIGIVLVVLLIILIIFCNIVYNMNFKRKKAYVLQDTNIIKTFPKVLDYDKDLRSRKYEDIYIESFDKLKLHAFYFKSLKETKKTIISIHGWYGNAISDSSFFSGFLYDDYNVLTVDLRGHGESESKYLGFSILDYKDILNWIDYLTSKDKEVEIALIGCSMGAATAILTSAYVNDNVKAIIADSGFAYAWDQLKYVMNTKMHLPAFPCLYIVNIISKLKGHYSFKAINGNEVLKEAKVPMLFIHGKKDNFVNQEFSIKAYEECGSKIKQLKLFDNASHANNFLANEDEYKEIVNNFLNEQFERK